MEPTVLQIPEVHVPNPPKAKVDKSPEIPVVFNPNPTPVLFAPSARQIEEMTRTRMQSPKVQDALRALDEARADLVEAEQRMSAATLAVTAANQQHFNAGELLSDKRKEFTRKQHELSVVMGVKD